jgi:hypothetical protein
MDYGFHPMLKMVKKAKRKGNIKDDPTLLLIEMLVPTANCQEVCVNGNSSHVFLTNTTNTAR